MWTIYRSLSLFKFSNRKLSISNMPLQDDLWTRNCMDSPSVLLLWYAVRGESICRVSFSATQYFEGSTSYEPICLPCWFSRSKHMIENPRWHFTKFHLFYTSWISTLNYDCFSFTEDFLSAARGMNRPLGFPTCSGFCTKSLCELWWCPYSIQS